MQNWMIRHSHTQGPTPNKISKILHIKFSVKSTASNLQIIIHPSTVMGDSQKRWMFWLEKMDLGTIYAKNGDFAHDLTQLDRFWLLETHELLLESL